MVEFVGHVGHHALVSGPLVHAVDGGGRLGVGLIRVGGRRVAVAVGRLVGALADMVLRHRHEPGGHGDEQQRGYDDYGGDYRRDAARPDARFPRGGAASGGTAGMAASGTAGTGDGPDDLFGPW